MPAGIQRRAERAGEDFSSCAYVRIMQPAVIKIAIPLKISSKDEEIIVLNGYLYHSLQQIFKDAEESITSFTVKHLTAER